MSLKTVLLGCFAAGLLAAPAIPPATEGSLVRVDPYGKATGVLCPLRHTDVKADIAGFIARVTVTQEFQNNTGEKIEAVYIFPLPAKSAVDRMTMHVGDRVVKAVIKKRDEARQIFEQARQQGHTAALLEQERPNVFTQSVTNIEPGAKVLVVISYVETLKYEEGTYEFSFPMTVGPRYNPQGLPGGERVVPKYAPPELRAGHDVSLEVKLDAGLPIDFLRSATHPVNIDRPTAKQAVVHLKDQATIPNKDFILKYDIAGTKIQDTVLAYKAQKGGFFTLILQPPERVTAEDVTPKELVFVLDTSGSMMGFPIEKAKETMKMAIAGLYPRDTFNFISFSGDTHLLFERPVPATPENIARAQEFLAGRRGGGGTEMMKAIRAALDPSGDTGKVRIVCFMTDGYVGNDFEIIAEVKKHPEARVFSFGIGSSVNHFLLDKMAAEGRGEVEYVGLNDDGSAAARRFHERVRNPLLTDIHLEYGNMPVNEVYPQRIPDLFAAQPVIVHGRYDRGTTGVWKLRGKMSGRDFVREIKVSLPDSDASHDALASVWAREKIEDLMSRDWAGLQARHPGASEYEPEITRLGLEFALMTQFTSFVAVEEKTVTKGGKPVVVEVPVEMPEGVSHQGVFGTGGNAEMAQMRAAASPMGVAYKSMAPMLSRDQAVAPRSLPAVLKEKKLDSSLATLVAGQPAAAGLKMQNGRVAVEVWLNDASDEVLAKLKAMGFEPIGTPKVAKIRVGWIRIEKLRELETLTGVVSVLPYRG